MAGPSIVVRVLGDLKALGGSMDTVATKAQGAASKAHTAFSGFVDGLNKTGIFGPFASSIGIVDDAVGNLLDHTNNLGEKMMGIGGAMTGVGATLSAFGSKEQASHQQLQQAVDATGKSYDDYGEKIEGAIKHQENFGNTSAETQDALKTLTQATNDPAKAISMLGTASDLAASEHESLGTAASQLAKGYNGSTKIFKQYGITVEKTGDSTKLITNATSAHTRAVTEQQSAQRALDEKTAAYNSTAKHSVTQVMGLQDAQKKVKDANLKVLGTTQDLKDAQDKAKDVTNHNADAVDALGKKLKGQASAGADTFMGKLDGMKAKIEDSVSQFGQKYGPAMQIAGTGIMALGTIWQIAGPLMAAGGAEAGAGEAAALWPIALIVVGVIALIAIIYELWKHWSTVWGWIKDAAKDVWDWIKSNWPLLLDILFGPIGFAVGLIIKNFGDIKTWAKDAYDFIVNVWNGIVGFFQGIVSSIKGFFTGMWTDIKNAFNTAKTDVENIWNAIKALFKAPDFGGFWDGIKNAFKSAINGIIDLWNGLKFPSISIGPFHTPEIGTPNIPHLAQGGLITASGLVYAHAGEAISPIPNGVLGNGGPAVNIEHATFATELDVDAFMARAAWAARTAVL